MVSFPRLVVNINTAQKLTMPALKMGQTGVYFGARFLPGVACVLSGFCDRVIGVFCGAVVHLGERITGSDEVEGSNPSGSTSLNHSIPGVAVLTHERFDF